MPSEFLGVFKRYTDDPLVQITYELETAYTSNIPPRLQRKKSWKDLKRLILRKKEDGLDPSKGYDNEVLMYMILFLGTPRVDIQMPRGKCTQKENYGAFKGMLEIFMQNATYARRLGLDIEKVDYVDDKMEIHAKLQYANMQESRNVYF